jgi:DNA polymerase (family 10)
LELTGENPFKVHAYPNAARALLAVPGELGEIIASTGLKGIKGIGEGMCARILEIHETGALAEYDEVRAQVPDGLIEMLRIPGIGPKKVKAVHDSLGITTVGELEYACHENRLVDLPGFGAKTQEKILDGIAFIKKHAGRFLWSFASEEADKVIGPIRELPSVVRAEIAGSIRRRKETAKDIDILAASDNPEEVMDAFVKLPDVDTVTAKGDTKSSVVLVSGIAVDIRVVSDTEYPYALHHFTGSKEHNTAMRSRSKKLGLKMNEYGLFREPGDKLVKCADEEGLFGALGLGFIPPELREDMGEIEAAENHTLPKLVEDADIRGVFHVHSRYSDGVDEIAEIAEEAVRLGYEYVGLADHSPTAAYAGGLDADGLKAQQKDIDKVNKKYAKKGFRILKGAEVDILPDGSLDYDAEILSGLDFTVCSIHSRFNMTMDEATNRTVRAIEDPHCTMIGHPTGRLLLAREGYPIDMRKVIEACAANRVAVELNAHPIRLDIDWREMRYAKELGVRICINPDAHRLEGLRDVRYGVGIARKGWLEAGDVLNTMGLDEVLEYLKGNS